MIPNLIHFPANPTLKGQASLIQDVPYSKNGQTLTLILPWAPNGDRTKIGRIPLIVFVQGSGWNSPPNLNYEIPMLCHYAEEGIAVATVRHRSTADGDVFPAFLIDLKCAVRFLRAHAEEYGIDPSRVAAFGTSSGGNAVCLLGLTGDDPAYKSDEYPDESDAVCSVVSCFAPTDFPALYAGRKKKQAWYRGLMTERFGPDHSRWDQQLREFSPACRVIAGKKYPPFLLLHGSGDTLVPYSQMEKLYRALQTADTEVKAVCVDGGAHEGNFWGPEVRAMIHKELTERLGIQTAHDADVSDRKNNTGSTEKFASSRFFSVISAIFPSDSGTKK